jgi:hypothetical protein
MGNAVAGAGDVNGDGYADVIVGARLYDAGETDEGAAFVFPGRAEGIADGNPATAAAQLESDQAGANMGNAVAGAGDVNGDGCADVIVGARNYGSGIALVFLGNGEGRPVRPEQLRGDTSGKAVQPWGAAWSETSFVVEMTATHPEGRGRVKLELEACPSGVAFGDESCTRELGANWSDVTATPGAVRLAGMLTGLDAQTLYRWRARVFHAPYTVTQSGITPPPSPAHGPWKRISAQAVEADIRTLPEPGGGVLLVAGLACLVGLGRRRIRA